MSGDMTITLNDQEYCWFYFHVMKIELYFKHTGEFDLEQWDQVCRDHCKKFGGSIEASSQKLHQEWYSQMGCSPQEFENPNLVTMVKILWAKVKERGKIKRVVSGMVKTKVREIVENHGF